MVYDPCMVRNPFLASAAIALGWLASLPAQDDLRDRITLSNGRVVEGRVQSQYKTDELTIMQGGKRVRVNVAQIAKKELVADKMVEFFNRRHRHQNSKRALRYLVDWAESNGLRNMARLQAMELVLQDDTNADLHKFLGHKKRGKSWLWPNGNKTQTLAKLQKAMLDRPFRIEGERFALRCDTSLLLNVRVLFDLEQLGVTWFDRYGKDLELREVLDPIEIQTFRNPTEFPKWGFRPRPYFEPPPHADLGRTFYAGPSPDRPEQLFFLGTQGLLYRTMIGQANRQNNRDRICAWIEIGLGQHMEEIMRGPSGFAKAGKPQKQNLAALRALGRNYRLTHLIHLPMYGSFYLTDDMATSINWNAASMFVTWLLDDSKQDKTRANFLNYIRRVLIDRQGDSSSAFDRIMGKPIERFEEPWHKWLNKLANK